MGQLLKERMSSYRRKFFPLSVDLDLIGLCHPGKQTGSHKSCFPLQIWQQKHGSVPIHINNNSEIISGSSQ